MKAKASPNRSLEIFVAIERARHLHSSEHKELAALREKFKKLREISMDYIVRYHIGNGESTGLVECYYCRTMADTHDTNPHNPSCPLHDTFDEDLVYLKKQRGFDL